MGILIIATTFFVTSNNANGPAAFAQTCRNIVNLDISGLPGQTGKASINMPVSGGGNAALGIGQLNIPGIGTANIAAMVSCPPP